MRRKNWQFTFGELVNACAERYGALQADRAMDAIERAVCKTLSHVFGVPFTVRLGDEACIWMDRHGGSERFEKRLLNKKIRRHLAHEIEKELQITQAMIDLGKLRCLTGQVVQGTARRYQDNGDLYVEMRLQDSIQSYILIGVCPLEFQPPHERGRLTDGSRSWYVTSVTAKMYHNTTRVIIRLSRTSWKLPVAILESQGIKAVRCSYRYPGVKTELVTLQKIDKQHIEDLRNDLRERIFVRVQTQTS